MSNWTVIPDTDTDADSPLTEDLVTDIKENAEYLHERAVRAGTHTVPVRLAFARGVYIDTASTDGGGDTGIVTQAITFAAEAIDGDPNFSVAPTVVVSIQESTAHDDWGSPSVVSVWLDETAVSTTGFTVSWQLVGGAASAAIGARISFFAAGLVTSGE